MTWTHNDSQYGQDTGVLQSTQSGMGGMLSRMFTSVLTIDSNEFSDSGSYCCVVAAVIGSGHLNKIDCVTLNVLGKPYCFMFRLCFMSFLQISAYQDSTKI